MRTTPMYVSSPNPETIFSVLSRHKSPDTMSEPANNYRFVGKRARVHLYTREGIVLGTLEGRVADVSPAVPVGQDAQGREIKKDLAYLVDIEPGTDENGEPVAYRNSAGTENEGWFALQDMQIIDDQDPITNLRFN